MAEERSRRSPPYCWRIAVHEMPLCRIGVESRRVQNLSGYWRLPSLLLLAFACSGCLFSRILYYNKPTLAVVRDFDARSVRASSEPLSLARSEHEAQFPLTRREEAEKKREADNQAAWKRIDDSLKKYGI